MKEAGVLWLCLVSMSSGCGAATSEAPCPAEPPPSTGGDLDGAWRLVEFEFPDPAYDPPGHQAMLIVREPHFCTVRQWSPDSRPSIGREASRDQLDAERALALMSTMTARCGRFTRAGDRVTVEWQLAESPDEEGMQAVFVMRRTGTTLRMEVPDNGAVFTYENVR